MEGESEAARSVSTWALGYSSGRMTTARTQPDQRELDGIRRIVDSISEAFTAKIVGQRDLRESLLIGLLADGLLGAHLEPRRLVLGAHQVERDLTHLGVLLLVEHLKANAASKAKASEAPAAKESPAPARPANPEPAKQAHRPGPPPENHSLADHAFDKSAGAGDNLVPLHEFRRNLGGTREEQDQIIREGQLAGTSSRWGRGLE